VTIPEEIRDFETYIVAYSGGKDSTATLLWAREHLPREKLRFVFCDTGAEWPETYEYLGYIERELKIEIERIRAGDREMPPTRSGQERDILSIQGYTLFEKIRLRGKWPNPAYRYCTAYLKQWPIRLYVRELPNPLQISGIRAEESQSRSERVIFDPQGNKTGGPMFYPVLDWSERQVWDYLRAHHILPNPVYNYATRCGCWCCIMGRDDEVLNFCRLHPDIAQEAADLEEEIGHAWRDRQSIGNLLRQAQAQMPLFERRPRFELVGS
jgi:3'-phosphoadenosine 5'-phosphosulfate sulfotransferase (PAPS reductase)/FAD synthetase